MKGPAAKAKSDAFRGQCYAASMKHDQMVKIVDRLKDLTKEVDDLIQDHIFEYQTYYDSREELKDMMEHHRDRLHSM